MRWVRYVAHNKLRNFGWLTSRDKATWRAALKWIFEKWFVIM